MSGNVSIFSLIKESFRIERFGFIGGFMYTNELAFVIEGITFMKVLLIASSLHLEPLQLQSCFVALVIKKEIDFSILPSV